MKRCVDSLLDGAGDDVEIIIVDDGSTDSTPDIADNYGRKFAETVRVIHQQNSGHGGAINTGLAAAAGVYFKVVDSDDYAGKDAYAEILAALRGFISDNIRVDLVVSNYVYEKAGKKRKSINFLSALPEKRIAGWENTQNFSVGKYLLMHALTYRTDVLRQSALILPRNIFYVDNLFAFIPLTFVKTLYYINADFYRYSIGFEEQSVKESTMIKQIDQQITVNKMMFESVDLKAVTNKKLKDYLLHYLEIATIISMIFLVRSGNKESLKKKKELWEYVMNYPAAYEYFRRRIYFKLLCLTGAAGRFISVLFYHLMRFKYGFN
uniref:Glycosyltransferase n=1 Tax=uncultured bacterium contig00019 TaxID=1181510 RepID=A0A806K000_9BACT|nr:glycosyltransferase [uncultured bacterium contig00019]